MFCREKISLSGTLISLRKIADLPIWVQEKITCMQSLHCLQKLSMEVDEGSDQKADI